MPKVVTKVSTLPFRSPIIVGTATNEVESTAIRIGCETDTPSYSALVYDKDRSNLSLPLSVIKSSTVKGKSA